MSFCENHMFRENNVIVIYLGNIYMRMLLINVRRYVFINVLFVISLYMLQHLLLCKHPKFVVTFHCVCTEKGQMSHIIVILQMRMA
jgi:hypothetical protein